MATATRGRSAGAPIARGVLGIDELLGCGFTYNAVAARVRRGWFKPLYEGVYLVGRSELSPLGGFIAAVKACGDLAALSHRSCTVFYGALEWEEGRIDVTVRTAHTHCHNGIRVHRSRLLERSDLRYRNGMWVVSPEWALLGLASQVGRPTLKVAIRRAYGLELVSVRSLAKLLGRVGPVRGSRPFADVLAQGYRPTRSGLENVVLDLILDAGFEPPEVNQRLIVEGRPYYPDFRWPDQRLIVEADSRAWHDDPIARAEDAERQAILEASGERFVRVSFEQATVGRVRTLKRIFLAGAPHPDRSP